MELSQQIGRLVGWLEIADQAPELVAACAPATGIPISMRPCRNAW